MAVVQSKKSRHGRVKLSATHTTAHASVTRRRDGARAAHEPFVVLICNVENDFAKVHQALLPSFCGLDVRRERHTVAHTRATAPGTRAAATTTTAAATSSSSSCCTYELRCRTETRSAELCVYGDADSDVATIFASSTRPPSSDGGHTQTTEAKGSGDDVAATDAAVAARTAKSASTTTATMRDMARLEHLCHTLQHRPYTQYPLQVQLRRLPCTGAAAVTTTTAATTSTAPRSSAAAAADDAAGVDAHTDGKDEHSGHDTQTVTCEGGQAALVTAVAVVSAGLPAREMRRRLRDVPGFVSCWPLRPRHFRVVFADAAALFKAKQLLDQFELDGNIRVTLQLSDALQRRHDAFAAM